MKTIVTALIIVITAIGMAPFLGIGAKIEWAAYLGVPLVILTGSAGAAFVTRRFEAIIGGVVISALWPVIYETARSVLGSL